jgi:hypothetical protein
MMRGKIMSDKPNSKILSDQMEQILSDLERAGMGIDKTPIK